MTGVAIIEESSPRVRPAWRGGRVVYDSGLENQRVFTGTVGSNPTLSAFITKQSSERWTALGGHPQQSIIRQNRRTLLSGHSHRDDLTHLLKMDT